jgi:hypothetical protein
MFMKRTISGLRIAFSAIATVRAHELERSTGSDTSAA